VLGDIDLDPASNEVANVIIGAKKIYTINDSGLAQDWRGRVFMNPPYSGDLVEKFIAKLVGAFAVGDVTEAVVLVNNATETKWFQRLASNSSAICFPSSRIKYWKPDKTTSSPLQGQAFCYFGKNAGRFKSAFETIGFVMGVL